MHGTATEAAAANGHAGATRRGPAVEAQVRHRRLRVVAEAMHVAAELLCVACNLQMARTCQPCCAHPDAHVVQCCPTCKRRRHTDPNLPVRLRRPTT